MGRRRSNYTVRTGDTAATIAKQLGIDPQTLMRANTGVGNLRPGTVLGVPATTGITSISSAPGVGDEIYPPATQPIPAYMVPAGYGAPTDYSQRYFGVPPQEPAYPGADVRYDTVLISQQVNMGATDADMAGWGYTRRGNVWMRPSETLGVVGSGGATTPSSDMTIEQYRATLDYSTSGAFSESMKDTLGSDKLWFGRVGDEASEGGFNVAYRRGPTGSLTKTPISGATRRHMERSGSIYQTVGRSWAGEKGKARRAQAARQRARRRATSRSEAPSSDSGAVGGAASYQQQNYGYGGASGYMPSVRKFARPNYLGLINWRV